MFTGIVQGIAHIVRIQDQTGLRRLLIQFPSGFAQNLQIGASVACDGVCLTVTDVNEQLDQAQFDVMQQTLQITTLAQWQQGQAINVERAAKAHMEVGGHILSGHIDGVATLIEITHPENNTVLHFQVPSHLVPYIFSKGYIAINGASLTIANVDEAHRRFEVWLIPETLRMTTFPLKQLGDGVNLEIERSTQVIVDTVKRFLKNPQLLQS